MEQKNTIKIKQSGFTLIELSVVIAIIGVILYCGMSLLIGNVQATQTNYTVASMNAIEKALLNYRVAFGRIPCPSDLTATVSSANYGVEAANMGSCTGGSPAANFSSASGTVEGGVPTRALRLPDSFMFDGWGHRIRYAVNPSYTTVNASCTSSAGAITINDASGSARSSNAIYALLSHGANGHGGYTAQGIVVNAGSTNADELTNCHCTSTGAAGTYAPAYVQKAVTMGTAGSLHTAFDDIVSYKEGWQMMTHNLTSNSFSPCTSYYRTVTIDHTKVGTVNNTDQSNFPVLLSGTYSYLATVANGGNVQNANGYDITFTSDAAGKNLLPFECESYNAATGAVNYWVQVPTISHTTDTVIYMQYGSTAITTDQSNKNATWDTNFKGVWHLNESSGTINADSTSNGLNATKTSASHPNPITGNISGAQQFNNSGTQGVAATDYDTVSDNSAIDFSGDFTVSVWIKSSQSHIANYWPMIMTKDNSSAGYDISLFNGTSNSKWYFEIWNASVQQYTASGSSSITDGSWHYLVGLRSGSTIYAYQDGVAAGNNTAFSSSVGSSTVLKFGTDPTNTDKDEAYVGTLEEIRISGIARSADWIKTEYNNQSSPSTFYTIGAAAMH